MRLTGLYYLRARYYNTGIGRFTQEDVIYNDGLNLYAYCSSNPVMYEDQSGYSCEPKDGAENSKGGRSSELGNKLDYIFGKATGDKHNIERSISMENLLNKIGIFDNASGREYIYTC